MGSKEARKTAYDVLWIGIAPDRKTLRAKIRDRLLVHIRRGMVAETRQLHKKGLSYRRMEELGLEYRYLALFLQKKITKEDMIEELATKIWQYARRQLTYWRRNKNIHWFKPDEKNKISRLVSEFLHV